MNTLRILSFLSVLGGAGSAVLTWSHGHPHDVWSLWTVSDLFAVVLVVWGLRYVNRRVSAIPAAARMSAILAEPQRRRSS